MTDRDEPERPDEDAPPSEPDESLDTQEEPSGEAAESPTGADPAPAGTGAPDESNGSDSGGAVAWLRSWLYTTDHMRIGIIYLWALLFYFFLAGFAAMLFRTELLTPQANTIVTLNEYNSLVTLHGITMIFLVVVPAGSAFGNMLIPKMVGADEMAFPRLNAFGAWILFAGGILLWWPAITYMLNLTGLPFYGGWFGYTPMSTTLTTVGARTWPLSVIVLGFGTTGTAINFLVTVLNERDPDMSLLGMPIFIWGAGIITPILTVYALPWLTAAMGMVYFEATYSIGFFNPRLGGAPVLYQHLFWLFGHPEVYIVIIPVFTAVLTILPRFAGRPLWGRNVVIGALLWIMLASCLVWAHHMFTSGLHGIRLAFMFTTLSIALAFSLILFSMAATLWRGRNVLRTPMLFAVGFILLLVVSGLDGIMLALPPYNMIVHDTWFVVGHFHFTLFGGSIMGMFAAIYYWYPLATGKMYSEFWGKIHAATTIVAAPTVFFLMGKLGEHGMIRRYASYTFAPELQTLHVLTTAFAYLLGASQVVFGANLLWSLKYGEDVTNPWDDLLAGQDMPSPEWPGDGYDLPYQPPTPENVDNPDTGDGAVADGGTSGDDVATDGGTTDDGVTDRGTGGSATTGGSTDHSETSEHGGEH